METTMSGVTADEQVVLSAIKAKLHPETVPQPGVAVAPKAERSTTQLAQDADLNPQPAEALAEVQPGEGQPAEGQIAEGEAVAEAAMELPPTLKVTIKDDEGKDVEQELPVDEVRSGYMRHADYTRKTQALAKERAVIPQKIAESERVVTETRNQYTQNLQHLQALAVNAAAPELQGVDWNRLAVENPSEHVRLTQRANQLNATLAGIQNEQKRVTEQAQAQQKKAQMEAAVSARETLNREIPGGWNDELYAKIQKGAVNHYGYTQEEFSNIVDARAILMANDALKYRELVSGKPIAQQKVEKAPLAVRPGAAPTTAEKQRSAVEKVRETARKSGSVDDAVALMQARRANPKR